MDPVSYDFTMDCVDLYTLLTSINVPRTASVTVPEALMIQGYLATSPVDPTFAISIKTLELFRRLRCHKASLSVEAYAKVLCDLYAVRTLPFLLFQTLRSHRSHIIGATGRRFPIHLTSISRSFEQLTVR